MKGATPRGPRLVDTRSNGVNPTALDRPRVLIGLFVVTATGLMLFGGTLGSCGILILAVGLAYLLYRRFPVTYVSFVWWLFFLVCFARRVIDYRSGYSDQNVILATPLLAAMVCAPALFEQRVLWKLPIALPFVLGFASALYGLGVGVLCIPAKTLLVSTIGWFAPLIFGFFILSEFLDGERREAHIHSLSRTFCWGILIMGAYGIYQYVVAPAWDVLWMNDSAMGSIGSPEPFGIRVFGTMNGPGPFAYAIVAGLMLVLCRRGLLSAVAGALGVGALLLTSVRAAWAALAVGLLLFLIREKKYRARALLAISLVGVCIAVAFTFPPARQTIQDRLQSFTDLHDDASYQDRTSGYSEMLPYAEDSPFGSGLGTMDAKFQDDTSLGTRDSGIWEILLSLGWIGGAVQFVALGLLVFRAWPWGEDSTPIDTAAACISIGLLSQMALGSVNMGVTGLTIWSFGAMAMARFGPLESPSRKGAPWIPDPAAA
ncbi:MAG TPA: O-antigen ligase family protein [Acidobacteriaceae bacterium]|jgi:O-antigen ligase|nr:O-antigen ligase family protein [Acidobacteriaceae bacterium]